MKELMQTVFSLLAVPSHYKEAYQQVELVRKTELVEDTVGW
jgi:hypothetical protein